MGPRPKLTWPLLHAAQRAPAVPFDFEEPRQIRKRAVGQCRKGRRNPVGNRRPPRSFRELHISLFFWSGFFEIACRAIGDPLLLRTFPLRKDRSRVIVNLQSVDRKST